MKRIRSNTGRPRTKAAKTTNYDKLRTEYLAKPINRKLYEIETAKLEPVEKIDRLAKAKSSKEQEALFASIDYSLLSIKDYCNMHS